MALIRSAFQDELDGVSQSLVDLASMVTESMKKATEALLAAELRLAEDVISADEKIDNYQHELDSRLHHGQVAAQDRVVAGHEGVVPQTGGDVGAHVRVETGILDRILQGVVEPGTVTELHPCKPVVRRLCLSDVPADRQRHR